MRRPAGSSFMVKHTGSVSKPAKRLFIEALESPPPAACKELPWPPRITTMAVGEECYKGV